MFECGGLGCFLANFYWLSCYHWMSGISYPICRIKKQQPDVNPARIDNEEAILLFHLDSKISWISPKSFCLMKFNQRLEGRGQHSASLKLCSLWGLPIQTLFQCFYSRVCCNHLTAEKFVFSFTMFLCCFLVRVVIISSYISLCLISGQATRGTSVTWICKIYI